MFVRVDLLGCNVVWTWKKRLYISKTSIDIFISVRTPDLMYVSKAVPWLYRPCGQNVMLQAVAARRFKASRPSLMHTFGERAVDISRTFHHSFTLSGHVMTSARHSNCIKNEFFFIHQCWIFDVMSRESHTQHVLSTCCRLVFRICLVGTTTL
jgi:hypothetical protein